MRLHHLLQLALVASACVSLSAQSEVLYYKFEGGGAKALNYAQNSPAPGEGPVTNLLTTAPLDSFVPGPYGQALQGGSAVTPYQSNSVDTGWAPNVTGDYTWAMWIYNSRANPGPGLTYIAGIPVSGAFRIYGGSSILLTVGGAGGSTYYSTVANVYQMATAGWTHVAFVVDTVAMTGTYYINGVPEVPRVLTALPNIQGTSFMVGRQLPASAPSIYDIDEFRFETRAVTAAEISLWATTNPAGESRFGQGCDASMAGVAGLPQVGNLFYGLEATTSVPNSVGFITLGFSRTSANSIPLPVDLGTFVSGMSGCAWECSSEVTQLVVLGPTGAGQLAFPILPDPGYVGIELYSQGLFIGGPRGLMSTNPVGIVIGN
jgi:hypothetical protein